MIFMLKNEILYVLTLILLVATYAVTFANSLNQDQARQHVQDQARQPVQDHVRHVQDQVKQHHVQDHVRQHVWSDLDPNCLTIKWFMYS